jgi:hypothetical protein
MAHARIGRIRMKAGAQIIPMRRGMTVSSDRKAEFLAHVGRCFDSYAWKQDQKPDAIVLVLGGIKQPAHVYWTIRGDSEGGGTSMLSLAASALTREIVEPS